MRILVLDIETTYLISGHWSLWGVNIGIDQILEGGETICYAARWVGENDIIWRRKGNADFLTKMHELLGEADVILTYNGKRFDLPLLNREFIKAGMPPPAPYKHMDLLETVKKQFRFPSNKLDYVCRELKVGRKVAHEGWNLWKKCREEDVEAWALMKKYNIQDIVILEDLYKVLKPWVVGHANEALYSPAGEIQCTTCGGTHVQKRGFHVTGVGRYQRYRCSDCGGWSRSRITDVSKEDRSHLLAPL